MLMVGNNIEPREGVCYYVMLTDPNREMTAQANLVIRHVPFYLPTVFRTARLPAGQHKARADHPDVPIPLFPRSIFIAEDIVDQKLELIRTAPGMRSNPFMKFGEHYAVLRPVGIAAILDIEASERDRYFSRKRKKNSPSWEPKMGQAVTVVLDEVLGGVRGTVSGLDSKGRITILTEIMKRTVRVSVTANQIEPV